MFTASTAAVKLEGSFKTAKLCLNLILKSGQRNKFSRYLFGDFIGSAHATKRMPGDVCSKFFFYCNACPYRF